MSSWRLGMTTSMPNPGERVTDVRFDDDSMSVDLADGRTITVPLAWYPRLLHATPEQRLNWQLSGAGFGIHWPDVDEDLGTTGLLLGLRAVVRKERGRKSANRTRKSTSHGRSSAPRKRTRGKRTRSAGNDRMILGNQIMQVVKQAGKPLSLSELTRAVVSRAGASPAPSALLISTVVADLAAKERLRKTKAKTYALKVPV